MLRAFKISREQLIVDGVNSVRTELRGPVFKTVNGFRNLLITVLTLSARRSYFNGFRNPFRDCLSTLGNCG